MKYLVALLALITACFADPPKQPVDLQVNRVDGKILNTLGSLGDSYKSFRLANGILVTKTVANASALTAAVPEFVGQLCIQTDIGKLVRATSTTAGGWDGFTTLGVIITLGDSTHDGTVNIWGNAHTMAIIPGTPTADRILTLPNASGTFALNVNKLSVFASTTSAELAGVISDVTGSGGGFVRANFPTFTAPTLGAASATSINGMILSGSGKTLTLGNSLTLTGFPVTLTSTATTSVTLPTTGTMATLAGTETFTNKTLTSPTLTTPALGVATATSINGMAISGSGFTLTLAGNLTTSGANAITLTSTGSTNVTLPTTGTLATLAGTETLTSKTLTTPKFADLGYIADPSGNELLIFDSVASAVNEVTIRNASTGNAPGFSATGGDANVTLFFSAKGTGHISLASPVVVGGNLFLPAVDDTTGIYDSDSNQALLTFVSDPDSQNHLSVYNAPGGNDVQIKVIGDLGEGLVITPMAGGTITLNGTTFIAGSFLYNGVTDGSSAGAGQVGQYASSYVVSGSAVSLTTATGANMASLSLTAGDWEVEANVNYTLTGATVTAVSAGISTTSATLPTDGSEGYSAVTTTTATNKDTITLPRKRINISTTTTVYAVAKATFSAGTVSAFGGITARRVH